MQWSSTACRHLLVLAGFAGGKLGKGERERYREWLPKLLFTGREGKGGKSSLVQAAAAADV